MAHHPSTPPQVPPAMLEQHRAGWHAFTRMMFWNCIATAAVLLFLLVIFKIL